MKIWKNLFLIPLIFKGMGAHAVPRVEEENQGSTSAKIRLQPPNKVHFENRVDIVNALNKKGEDLTDQKKQQKRLRLTIEQEKRTLDSLAEKTGFTASSAEILKDENCFLNRVTKEDAKELGNLSALVYDIDQKKSLKNVGSTTTSLDRDISTTIGEISMLEERVANVKPASLSKKSFNDFKKDLKVFGIEMNKKATVAETLNAMNSRISTLQDDLTKLQMRKTSETTEYLQEAKQVFAHNLQGMNYEVVGVFHRNSGEFSGVAAYDKSHKKLVLSFAGSKSLMDWGKNILGMNRKLSKGHGLLSNINFHSGFGSHLDDNADSFFSFMKSWLTKFKKENPNETLNLVGTGHSLGGSLGEIFSAAGKELAESMGIKVSLGVMTFGAPNTVESNTLDNFTKILGGSGNVIRFAQGYDPVPGVVFWKTSPSGVTIKRDTSLLSDVNGTIEFRINPHSSDDYYQAAVRVFEEWEKDLKPLKNQVKNIEKLEVKEKESEVAIGLIALDAHKLLSELVNQDKVSADVFQDEYETYVQKQKSELDLILDDLKKLEEEVVGKSEFSAQEKQGFVVQRNEFKKKIQEKKDFIAFLETDKAWKGYAKQASDDFDDMFKSITKKLNVY
jgi:hypothetical protein